MKKQFLSLLLAGFLALPISSVYAHPGKTDAHGGHTCHTNCAKWGLKDGEYHYQDKSGHIFHLASNVKVLVKGNQLIFDQKPVVSNNRTLVPLRAIFESLGAKVEWDEATKIVTGSKDNTVIKLTIGNSMAYKNSSPLQVDVPPTEINGRTMVPARFVAEALGATVGWNEATQTITITPATGSTTTPPANQTAEADNSGFIPAEVTHVVDGDTMDVTYNGKKDTVRLLLVDTPETHHPTKPVEPFGLDAAQYATSTLEGKSVKLELDGPERDKYGRLLVYLWIDNTTFNDMLLKKGLARVAYVYNPPYKHYDEYVADESKAKDQKMGIWSLQGYVTDKGYDDSFAK